MTAFGTLVLIATEGVLVLLKGLPSLLNLINYQHIHQQIVKAPA